MTARAGWLHPVEERWAMALLAAMIPPPRPVAVPDAEPPGLGELELQPFWPAFFVAAPWMLVLGLHVAVVGLTLLPLILGPRRRLFTGLDDDEKEAFLARMSAAPRYLLRQLVLVIKLCACLAYFRDPEVRRHFPRLAP
jgi:hypothetical protein